MLLNSFIKSKNHESTSAPQHLSKSFKKLFNNVIVICFFVVKFQTFLSAQNLIENPSFEDSNNCTNYNQFQCGCYPDAFYEACLQGAWHNATGTSALSDHWLNN